MHPQVGGGVTLTLTLTLTPNPNSYPNPNPNANQVGGARVLPDMLRALGSAHAGEPLARRHGLLRGL